MSHDGWRHTTLGEAARITIGRTPPRNVPRYWTDDLSRPFCTIADMSGRLIDPSREGVTDAAESEGKAKRVPAGALLMSFKLTIGRVGFAARDLFPNEAIARLQSTGPELDERFLALWLEAQDLTQGSGRAVKGSTLNSVSLRSIRVEVPPVPVQRRIVDVVGALDAHIANLRAEADRVAELTNQALLAALNSPSSLLTPLSDCMRLHLDREALDGETNYPIFGVLNRGQGLVDKGSTRGVDTGYTHLNRVKAGQVVMRKLTAWEGPIAVVPTRFNGFYGSAEFPSFTLDGTRLLPAFMAHLCRWSGLWSEMRQNVTGTVQRRKRLNPEQLLSVRVPVPPLHDQQLAADALDDLAWNEYCLGREAECAANFRSQLLDALLSREVEIPESYDDDLARLG